MRRLIASTFASLDGIMQAPGGPEEDPTDGFTLGGWTFGYGDAVMDLSESGFDGKDRELVLGRRTYEIFEAYWPYQPDEGGKWDVVMSRPPMRNIVKLCRNGASSDLNGEVT